MTLSLFCMVALLIALTPALAGPLSERVVFVSQLNGMPKIYICRSDGRDLQRLSKTPGPQLQPCYSPVNQRFYFVALDERKERLVSVDLEGEDLQFLTDSKSTARYPDVSTDGKTLIYSTDKWGSLELAQLDLVSGVSKRLTYDQASNTYPRYSPDGSKVLYLSRRHGQGELYLLTLSSGETERLTFTPFDEGPGSWRPDGRRIIASQLKPPRRQNNLLEIDLENGLHRNLLQNESRGVQNPIYSKDGTLVVFVRNQTLWTYDPADTKAHPFPLRGNFSPEFVRWIEFPLP